jgi:hypothetical protein
MAMPLSSAVRKACDVLKELENERQNEEEPLPVKLRNDKDGLCYLHRGWIELTEATLKREIVLQVEAALVLAAASLKFVMDLGGIPVKQEPNYRPERKPKRSKKVQEVLDSVNDNSWGDEGGNDDS